MSEALPAFAIVRIDRFQDEDEERVAVKRIVWTQELAESEVHRLNEINADKDCLYFWQYIRVDPPEKGR